MAGKYEFYKAGFIQAGMIVVDSVLEVVDVAKALAFQPAAVGNRVAIFSVQAGPGIIMADKCREFGLRLAQFSPATRQRLRQLGSPLNAVDNPVDLGWKSDEFNECREMLRVVLDDNGVDGIVVGAVFLGSNMELMRAVVDVAGYSKKPITVCLNSPRGAAYAEINALEESSIPTYPLPERAVSGLACLVRYGQILNGGGGSGIRTHGSDISEQRFSRPSP
jgi:acyl-CoA synthetase (NDP forming)